jgi:hypothetical protein
MNDMQSAQDVDPWLLRDSAVIRAAYPTGVPSEEYESLVYVLADSMSFRGVSRLLDYCGIRNYYLAYNDVLGIVDRHEIHAEKAKPILEKLIRHGYDPNAE